MAPVSCAEATHDVIRLALETFEQDPVDLTTALDTITKVRCTESSVHETFLFTTLNLQWDDCTRRQTALVLVDDEFQITISIIPSIKSLSSIKTLSSYPSGSK